MTLRVIFFSAALLCFAAGGALALLSPMIGGVQTAGGGGAGGTVACAYGITPFVGAAPAVAANAGFSTCAANFDFSNTFYATKSNWLDCVGNVPGVFWHYQFGNCDFTQVTDPVVTNQTVMRLHWQTSYGTSGGGLDQIALGFINGATSPTFPNFYIEYVSRVDAGSLQTITNTGGPFEFYTCEVNTSNLTIAGGGAQTEFDVGEAFTGNTTGYADAQSITSGCGATGGSFNRWATTNAPNTVPGGFSVTAYHKFGMLVTSDGLTAKEVCFWIDDVLQVLNQNVNTRCGAITPASNFSNRNYVLFNMQNFNWYSGFPSQDWYVQYMRIWECADWVGTPSQAPAHMCNGSSLVNTGAGPIYWQ